MQPYGMRIAAIQKQMMAQQVSHLILGPSANLFYLTGLSPMPDERLQLLVIPAQGEPALVLPELYRTMVEEAGGGWTLYTWGDGQPPEQALQKLLAGVTKAAVDEQLWAMHLLQLLPFLQSAQLVEASQVVGEVRMHKDSQELQLLKKAAELADAVVPWVIPQLHEGITEKQVAFLIERCMREAGAEGISFRPVVGFGSGSADPHHTASDLPLQKGQMVVMDFGCKWKGYCSDMTRTICFGKATPEMRQVYEIVLAANRAGFAAAKAGTPCEQVDAAARKVITDAGYGEYFIHRTGHGLGLDDHEETYIVAGNRRPLEEGLVFSIEPGIYLPGRFGVRIEDIAAMTPEGVWCLNECPRELIEVE